MEAGLDFDVRMLKLNLLNLFVNAMRQAGCICKKNNERRPYLTLHVSICIYYLNNINGKYSNISDQDRKTKRLCVTLHFQICICVV